MLGLVAFAVPAIALAEGAPPGTCALSSLDGVRLLLTRASVADSAVSDSAEIDRRWREFARAATAVVGVDVAADADAETRAGYLAALQGRSPLTVACDAGAVARDRTAYKLGLLGYTPDEIARIVTRQAARADIDRDAARRLVGLPPRALTVRASTVEAPRAALAAQIGSLTVRAKPAVGPVTASSGAIDWWTRYYSLAYGVDYRLVTAVIRNESNWQPAIVSPKGAVGLMQLMPATAAMLRVDPRDPIENLRGGIAYLARLLTSYGSVRSALIAYNAGPTHADQVLRGERVPFPETERYLSAVDALYPIDAKR